MIHFSKNNSWPLKAAFFSLIAALPLPSLAEGARAQVGFSPEGTAQQLVLEQGLLSEGTQFVTRLGQGDGAVVAHKQRLAEILLQPLDLTRQRRRANVHRPCAAAKVAALRQVEKDF